MLRLVTNKINNVRKYVTVNINGIEENIITRSEFSMDKVKNVLHNKLMSVIGYGVQGRSQSLNLRDNGLNVIVGVRKNGSSWDNAIKDGWIPNKTLFDIDEASYKGSVIMYLLSDAGQKEMWNSIKDNLDNKTLMFSHGFSVIYKDQTGVIPSKYTDVILVAPKGSGTSVRQLFLHGSGINSSYAVYQDYSGNSHNIVKALGFGIGSAHLFETTFEKEVYSDLTGERGVLMGGIYGLWMAQYITLREKGHSPIEAYNETVEEATQSLYPLIGEKGMDWMYANCSTTAQRGALDWYSSFYEVNKPLFEKLYNSVKQGKETTRVLEFNGKSNYRELLDNELKKIYESEMWEAGRLVRSFRPK